MSTIYTNLLDNKSQTLTTGSYAIVTSGNPSVTLTSGDLTISGTGAGAAGNLNLPNTNTAAAIGVINFGGNRFIHNYGSANCFIGYNAGNTTLTGSGNACFGEEAGLALTTGANSTLIGVGAGEQVKTGTTNICVGYSAGSNYTSSESSNLIIGNGGVISESNQIRIGTQGGGTGQQNQCNIAGIYGNTPGAGGTQNVVIDSAGNMGSAASSGPTPHNFLVYLSTTTGGVIGDNNNYKLPFDTVLYDTDSGYNLGTSTYTIPTTGIWMFGANVGFTGTGPGSWAGVSYVNMFFEGGFSLMAGSEFIQCILDNIDAETAVNTSIFPSYTASTMGTFAAGDTITLRVAAGGAASNLVAIQGNTGEFFTQFYGAQIG